MFRSLLFWDKVLIVAFTIFIVCILIGILYVNMPILQRIVKRKLTLLIEKLEKKTAWLSDYEEYDEEWMDYERWKKTNI